MKTRRKTLKLKDARNIEDYVFDFSLPKQRLRISGEKKFSVTFMAEFRPLIGSRFPATLKMLSHEIKGIVEIVDHETFQFVSGK